MEQSIGGDNESYFVTKYMTPRDEVLGEMGAQGWANRSTGSVESPTGYVEAISNSEADLIEIHDAFEETIAEMSRFGFTPEQLLGHFRLITDEQGFVTVTQYRRQQDLEHDFDEAEAEYSAWQEAQE
jgi:hypothetical protein